MKSKWLLVIACVLMTACNGTKEDDSKKKTDESESAALTQSLDRTLVTFLQDEDKSEEKTQDQDADKEESQEDDLNPLEKVDKKLNDARKAFMKKYTAAAEEDRQELVQEYPRPSAYVEEVLEIAKKNAGTELGGDANLWLASNAEDEEVVSNAYNILFKDYIDSEKMKDLCMGMIYATPSAKVAGRLKTLREKSPHDSVRAMATYATAEYMKQLMESKGQVDDERMVEYYGEEAIDYIKNAKVDNETIADFYQDVVDNYADVEIEYGPSTRKVADMASAALFEIKYLSVGCEAPDIEGSDLDGVEFKLSDYRGKVVMLDFWGDW